jgi:DNA-binding GntR family transcriptional regulator
LTAAERLATRWRTRILEGEWPGDTPLREQHISNETGASRHTVRAALRELAAEGLVTITPNRGAFVRVFTEADIRALAELRIALEVEAARLALERHDGRLPRAVHKACEALTAACASGAFSPVTTAHERLHHAIVEASKSPRLVAVHRPLAREMILFLVQLRPFWDMGHLAAEHEELLRALESDGPDALRVHIMASTEALTTGLKF